MEIDYSKAFQECFFPVLALLMFILMMMFMSIALQLSKENSDLKRRLGREPLMEERWKIYLELKENTLTAGRMVWGYTRRLSEDLTIVFLQIRPLVARLVFIAGGFIITIRFIRSVCRLVSATLRPLI